MFVCRLIESEFPICNDLEQGSQTRGPPDAFVRPAITLKNDKSIKFDQIYLILTAFLVNCGLEKLVSFKLRPAKHFFSKMWFSDQFEFETPDLELFFFIFNLWNYFFIKWMQKYDINNWIIEKSKQVVWNKISFLTHKLH